MEDWRDHVFENIPSLKENKVMDITKGLTLNPDQIKSALVKFVEILPEFPNVDHLICEAIAHATEVPFFPEWFNGLSEADKEVLVKDFYAVLRGAFGVVNPDDKFLREDKENLNAAMKWLLYEQSLLAQTGESSERVDKAIDHLQKAIG